MASSLVGPELLRPPQGTTFHDKPLQPAQARAARRCIAQAPPLLLTEQAAQQSAAYRARHLLPGVASAVGLDERQSAALSNWRSLSDPKQRQVANSMAMLYDQSKVTQQMVSKMVCILALKDSTTALKSFNLTWPEYHAKMRKADAYMEKAKGYSIGLLPPEGASEAAKQGAKVPFTPADLRQAGGSSEPWPSELDIMAGRGDLYGIKPGDEQQALQALQVAKAAFSGPRAPESETSSRFSSPERSSPDQKHLEKALQLLADTRMVFPRPSGTA